MDKQTSEPAPRRPHSAEAATRWNDILDAAALAFYEKGYEGASLQQIAQSVGLLKGSIYYYIKSKEDLLFALVSRAQEEFEPTLLEDPELAASSAPVRLRAFVERWMALTEKMREWHVVAEREFSRLSPRYLQIVIERRDAASAFVKSIIRQGVSEGDFDPDVDLSVATTVVFELMLTTHLWHRPGSRLTFAQVASWYADFIVQGLGHRRREARPPAVADTRPASQSKRALTTRA
jgi:AcrR family transcriptional regulator